MALNAKTGQAESPATYEGANCQSEKDRALFEKRKFRAYFEFTADKVVKFTTTKPFFLTKQDIWTSTGSVRVAVKTGATEGGTFTAVATAFPLNTTAPAAVMNAVITSGGTVTGGTERDVLPCDSGNGGGVGNTNSIKNVRYLAAGTYYIHIVTSGTPKGQYSLEWEETA